MNNTSRDALLMAVNQAGFAVTEANLYLDTHPCDSQAIAYLKADVTGICRCQKCLRSPVWAVTC